MKTRIAIFLSLFACGSLLASDLYGNKIHALDGADFDMLTLRGKVVLFVNVASRCGFTKQYDGLQKLYAEMRDQGFVIVGVPSNDFKGQEPGSPEEIAEFCRSKFSVDFPLTEKVSVTGPDKHPLYVFLTENQGGPQWNFHKILVNKQGVVVAEFPSKITPESEVLRAAIEGELAKP